ncbi:hypothetical protein [Halomonas sp. M4R1S46]|uniref:hypothetical protein n=1 Tax=Halomonas sp. M4R1S46 TaxID=2982692 RepID=UPI0021E4C0D7|nr:hypothetical protein [Halomonas sp. M4R1S46]UYG06241.1 hypothetical protein OCT48_11400 [Halomonas sp. M4R1S46]
MNIPKDIVKMGGIDEALIRPEIIKYVREGVRKGDVFIFDSGIDRKLLERIRNYLISVGKHSLPAYHPIDEGCPNFHRVNNWDARSYVKGCFHQFSFFPWNDDLFGLFEVFKKVYLLKNLISGLPADSFLSVKPELGCTSRLSFQYYPSGGGAMNKHMDPVDRHQLAVPTMLLCRKGEDFCVGGAFFVNNDGEIVQIDEYSDWGEVTFFNAQMVHGVAPVDPHLEKKWEDFNGRWIALFAVNKLTSTQGISDSVDLGL